MDSNLCGICILYWKFVMSFFINWNSIFCSLAFSKKINSIFIFVLNFVWRCFVIISILDNYNHLVHNLCSLFFIFLYIVKPFNVKPISLLTTSIICFCRVGLCELLLVTILYLTLLNMINSSFFGYITFIKFSIHISINISYYYLYFWVFLLSSCLYYLLYFYVVLICLARLHIRSLTKMRKKRTDLLLLFSIVN